MARWRLLKIMKAFIGRRMCSLSFCKERGTRQQVSCMQAVHNSVCVCVCVCVCVRACVRACACIHTEYLGHRLHPGQTHTCIFRKCTHTHKYPQAHTQAHTHSLSLSPSLSHTHTHTHTHTQTWDATQVMGFSWKTYISATVCHTLRVNEIHHNVCCSFFLSPPPPPFCCCCCCLFLFCMQLFQQHQPTFLKALFSSLSLRALRDWERRFTEDFTTFFGASVTGSKTSSSSGSSSSSPKPAANAKLLTHRFIPS